MSQDIGKAIANINVDWNARVNQMQYLEKQKYERNKEKKNRIARFSQIVQSPNVNIPHLDQRLEKHTKNQISGLIDYAKNNPDFEDDPFKLADFQERIKKIKNNPIVEEAQNVIEDRKYLEKQRKEGNISEDFHHTMIKQYEEYANSPFEGDDPVEGDGKQWSYMPEPKINALNAAATVIKDIGISQRDFPTGTGQTLELTTEQEGGIDAAMTALYTDYSDVIDYDWNRYKIKRNEAIKRAEETGQDYDPQGNINNIPFYADKDDFVKKTIYATLNRRENLTGSLYSGRNGAYSYYNSLVNNVFNSEKPINVGNEIDVFSNLKVGQAVSSKNLLSKGIYTWNSKSNSMGAPFDLDKANVAPNKQNDFLNNSVIEVQNYTKAGTIFNTEPGEGDLTPSVEIEGQHIPYGAATVNMKVRKQDIYDENGNFTKIGEYLINQNDFSVIPESEKKETFSFKDLNFGTEEGTEVLELTGTMCSMLNFNSSNSIETFENRMGGPSNANKINPQVANNNVNIPRYKTGVNAATYDKYKQQSKPFIE